MSGAKASEASKLIGAQAYATGNDVAFGTSPDLFTAAHEAAHVVQQRQGVQLSGGQGRTGDRYEKEADAVAHAVVRGESAEPMLGVKAPGSGGRRERAIQRRASPTRQEDVLDITERFVGVDPRMLRAIGMLIGVGETVADPPGPEFVEALKGWQADNGVPASGDLCEKSLSMLSTVQIGACPPHASIDVFPLKDARGSLRANAQSTQSGGRTDDTGEGSRSLVKSHTFVGAPIVGGVHPHLTCPVRQAKPGGRRKR